jgi:putrescine carbamoyltransferase
MTVRHLLQIQDFTREELGELIELIRIIKEADKQGATPRLLQDASLGMIFEEPSTRTRVSFEVAMTELGGHALYLKPGTVPVINGLTDYNHPTQVVCDVFTMMEHAPERKAIKDFCVTFVGDATNVLSSLMFICTKMGMSFTHAAPVKYQPPSKWRAIAEGNCQESGGTLTITEDIVAAVKNADFIYTDLWWWVGQEDEIPERRAAFMPTYQVNMELFKQAPAHCKFMHCLPASRGVEATDEVMDSPRSIIFDQSENRLHAEKGILTWLVYPRLKHPSAELRAYHKGRIESFVVQCRG